MILLENKLAIFNKLVYLKKEEECKRELEDVRKKSEELIENKKIELETLKKEIVSRRQSLANKKAHEDLALVKEQKRIRTLEKDEQILDELINELCKEAKRFRNSDEYVEFERKRFLRAQEELDEGEYIVKILDEDRELLEPLFRKNLKDNISIVGFEKLDDDKLGGFVVTPTNRAYNVDLTLRRKIEDSRYDIGKVLHFKLKEGR